MIDWKITFMGCFLNLVNGNIKTGANEAKDVKIDVHRRGQEIIQWEES